MTRDLSTLMGWTDRRVFYFLKIDDLVKSLKTPYSVIPVKTGIQFFQLVPSSLDSCRSLPSKVLVGGGNDDFLRIHHT